MTIYTVQELRHPANFEKTYRTIVGPGIYPEQIAKIHGVDAGGFINEKRLIATTEVLDQVYILGRRSMQSELRALLGFTWNGRQFELR